MSAITFDTLASAKRLKAKGIKPEDAEAFAQELRVANETDISHVATKEEFSVFKSEMRADFKHMEASLRELELRMTIKLGAMLVALAGFIKYFGHSV